MERFDEIIHKRILGIPVAVLGSAVGVLILVVIAWQRHVSAASGTTVSTVPNATRVNDTDLAGDGSANGAVTNPGNDGSTATSSDDDNNYGEVSGQLSQQQMLSQLTDWVTSLTSGYTTGKSADSTGSSTANQKPSLVYAKAPNNPDIYVTDTSTGVQSWVSKAQWDAAGDPTPTSTAAPALQLVKNSLDNTVYAIHGDGSQTYVDAKSYAAMGSPTVQTNNNVVKTPTLVKSANDATIYEVNPVTGAKTALTYAQWSAAGKPGFVTV